jgi:hypothetical protein
LPGLLLGNDYLPLINGISFMQLVSLNLHCAFAGDDPTGERSGLPLDRSSVSDLLAFSFIKAKVGI